MIPHALIAGLGAFALLCQTLLFRDFLTAFEGNELAVGTFFSSWFLWIALGAWIARRFERICRWLPVLILLYLPAFVAEHYLILSARSLGNVAAYAVFPYRQLIFLALITNAPVSFATGFFFPIACRWWQQVRHNKTPVGETAAAAQTYVIETLGAVGGGLLVTALLSHGAPGMSVFLAGALLLLLCIALTLRRPWGIFLAAGLSLMPFMEAGRLWTEYDAQRAWRRVLPDDAYQGSFVTPQGEYLYGALSGQFTVLSGGRIADVLPGAAQSAQSAALAMAQRPDAARTLIIGNNGLGLGAQFKRFPQMKSLAWMHADPEYPPRLLDVLPDELQHSAKNIELPQGDVRAYLASQPAKFDLILLNFSEPDTLSINRFFTQEFFSQVKKALSEHGVAGMRMTGAPNYLGGELGYLGASALATFTQVFPHTALKPGDETWVFGSRHDILTESPEEITARYSPIASAAEIFPPEALATLYPADRIAFQRERYQRILEKSPPEALINSDTHPKALLFSMLVTLRQAGIKGMAEHLHMKLRVVFWAMIGLPITYCLLRVLLHLRNRIPMPAENPITPPRHGIAPFDAGFTLFAAGFTGIASSLVLLFGYQSQFGSIYLHLGLLSALFMTGSFAGSALSERILTHAPLPKTWTSAFIAMHTAFLAGIVLVPAWTPWRYGGCFVACGFFTGAYFPWGARQLQDAGFSAIRAGAMLESWDHIGAAVGAIITGLILLPIFGKQSCTIGLMILIAINIPLLFLSRPKVASPEKSAQLLHAARYVMAGAALYMLALSYWADWLHRNTQSGLFAEHAAAIAETAAPLQKEINTPKGVVSYYAETLPGTNETIYIFDSGALAGKISGYGGPIRMAVAITADGTLHDVRLMASCETPSYLAMAAPWLQDLKHRNAVNPGFDDVDAVSGATITSKAILRTIQTASRSFAAQVLGKEVPSTAAVFQHQGLASNVIVLTLFMLLAPLMRIRSRRWTRQAFLLAAFLVMGVHFNLQYSAQHVFALLSGRIPPAAWSVSFMIIAGVPLYVAIFGNVYCGYLCPFGALQELAGDLLPRAQSFAPSREAWRYARLLKYGLLFLLIALFSATRDETVLAADPLTTIFGAARSAPVLTFSLALVLLSIPYPRFWCRNLCPAGAFLACLGALRIARFIEPKSLPGRCDMGVRNLSELDCLRCDRCRHAQK